MTTAAQVFNYIQMLNPSSTTVSSMGTFVTNQARDLAYSVLNEVKQHLPEGTLAHKIANQSSDFFTEKQLWVIAYELVKTDYAKEVSDFYARQAAKAAFAKECSRLKKAQNKEASAPALDIVKSAGKKLGDYYTFLKANKKFAKEFYSKKYSIESATEFINA